MASSRIDLLTDRQAECIRLVAEGMSDKEIAIALGIGHETVKTHVSRAMKLLGVTSRHQAARMLIEADFRRLSPEPVTPSEPLADRPALTPPSRSSAAAAGGSEASIPEPVGQVREDYPPFAYDERPGWQKPPFPTRGRPRNDLSWLQVIAWTIALTTGLAIASGVVTDGAVTATRIVLELTR